MEGEPTFPEPACTSTDDARDRWVVERYRSGDRQWFAEVVARYQQPLYNAAYWVTRREQDARDVAQTAFLKAAEHLDGYDPRYRFFSWLYRIAVNEALNLVRGRRDEPLDDDWDGEDERQPPPDARLEQQQRERRLRDAMKQLPTAGRVVLSMRHFSECSYAEIALALGLDEKTVKSRLFEARTRLRRLLEAQGDH